MSDPVTHKRQRNFEPAGGAGAKAPKSVAKTDACKQAIPTLKDLTGALKTRKIELVLNASSIQTGTSTYRICHLHPGSPKPRIFAVHVKRAATEEDKDNIRNVLHLDGNQMLTDDECDALIDCKNQLQEVYTELKNDKNPPQIIEVKSRSKSTPLSMFLDVQTGDVIIRSKSDLGAGGSFKMFRRVLIFPMSGKPHSAVEYRLKKAKREGPTRDPHQKEFLSAEKIAFKYKDCPYIINPAMHMLKKDKTYGEKYSFILEGANPKYPDLFEKRFDKTLKPKEIGKAILQGIYAAAKGLAELHKNGDVHRDVKFENIICMSDGTYKLADLDTVVSIEKAKTARHYMGTKDCLSPQAQGSSARSPKDDIYALGATTFLFTSEDPGFPITKAFSEATRTQLLNLVVKCLEEDPSKRFSADEVVKFIEEHFQATS